MAHDDHRLSRRGFLGVAAASVGAASASGLTASRASAAGASRTVLRNPLRIPLEASPAGLTLSAAPGIADLGSGRMSNVLAYNGFFPGPTIRARRGDGASVQFGNALAEETTVHWHGMVVPSLADGHPQQAVAPGGSYLYQFPIAQRACLNWYHAHPDGLTGKQVCLGLAGAFVINDAEEAALGLPSGSYEVPLIVRDASVDSRGNLVYKDRTSGFLGNIPLVNGTRDAKLDVDTALYRLRVLNGANARVFRLALGNGAPFTLIGNDGGLLETGVEASQIVLGPAERLDLLVDFRGLPLGTSVMLRDLDARWDLLEFVVTRSLDAGGSIPTGTLSTIPKLAGPVRTRTLHIRRDEPDQRACLLAPADRLQRPVRAYRALGVQHRRQCPAPGARARCLLPGAIAHRRTRPDLRVGAGLEGHRSPPRRRDSGRAHPLRWLPRPVPHALPQARARGHGHDDQLRGRLTAGFAAS